MVYRGWGIECASPLLAFGSALQAPAQTGYPIGVGP